MNNEKPEAHNLLVKLDRIQKKIDPEPKFDKTKHDRESRLKITTLFLRGFFSLIGGSFVFCAIYNFVAAKVNADISENPIPYLDVSNTVSIVTTTLGSGFGFVLGYYFKNGGDD